MSATSKTRYLSIGGNRHTAASAWSRHSDVLAFGADQNIAIWHPLSEDKVGIQQLLQGHNEKVGAVSFVKTQDDKEVLISGSADGQIVVWDYDVSTQQWHFVLNSKAHDGAVNAIATLDSSGIFVTGGANAEIRVWKLRISELDLITTISPKPRFIPLALELGKFAGTSSENALVLAAAGTRNDVFVYALKNLTGEAIAEHQATLRGHEGWIHSLAFKPDGDAKLILASASHDKYVRLWQFQSGEVKPAVSSSSADLTELLESTLTAKVQKVAVSDDDHYAITFEALLLGHEDWVYSAAWNPATDSQQLLTASADGSLAIWEPDPSSGIWISASKLGEISGQKGATTATGSAGGFWTGMWSPDGNLVTCLGRTGSWRLWSFDSARQYWKQRTGISGHVSSVNGLSWSPKGEYLLSTSSDQTTRLHAEWRRGGKRTWHEFSRPQIHGYDLNCVSVTSANQFASGADEKLLRVFNEPNDVARMLEKLCTIERSTDTNLPDAAAMPVLGLSNKATGADEEEAPETNGSRDQDYVAPALDISLAEIDEPPTEDLLARHTLWPEHEKLYGHGYEISESAYSAESNVLATACKASSTDHAVIRLYDANSWSETKPSLVAHSLTITRLRWSLPPDNLLLSVGRDRQWAVFKQSQDSKTWGLLQSNPKAHTRMILDAAWSPIQGKVFFATAGRDKTIKLWSTETSTNTITELEFCEKLTVKRSSAITAISFTRSDDDKFAVLAVGEDNGKLSIHVFDVNDLSLVISIEIPQEHCPSKSVSRLAWRGKSTKDQTDDNDTHELAVAAADSSVRIMALDVKEICARSR